MTFEKSLREKAQVAPDGSVVPHSVRESIRRFCPTSQILQRGEPRGEAKNLQRDMLRVELGAIQELPLKNQMTGPILTLVAQYACSEPEMKLLIDIHSGNCMFAGTTLPQTRCDDS